jgi:hypothetical protein
MAAFTEKIQVAFSIAAKLSDILLELPRGIEYHASAVAMCIGHKSASVFFQRYYISRLTHLCII